MRFLRRPLIVISLLFYTACGSLLNELDRIRLKAESGMVPSVTHTVPADGTFSAPVQSYADVVFDREISASSVSANSMTGACTGTVMVSMDNFASCFGITATASGNTIRISGSVAAAGAVPRGVILKIRISGVTGSSGVPANFYESAQGISFAAPCGQNCFYSESAPLTGAVTNGSHSFVIPSGTKAGGVITFQGVTSNTTFFNSDTQQTETGPPACCGIAAGSHSFEVKTLGGLNSGKVITLCGGGSTGSCVYDPGTNSFSNVGAPTGLAGSLPNVGSFTVPITAGPNAGSYVTFAGGTTAAHLYNVGTNSYSLIGSTVTGGTAIGPASSWTRLDNGNIYIVIGNGNSNTNIFNQSTLTFSSGANTIANINGGSFSFRANAGTHAGRILTAHGITAQSSAFDQAVTMFAGPVMPCNPGNGALTTTLTSGSRNGQTMIICGGVSPAYYFYDHSANSFNAISLFTGAVSSNSTLSPLTGANSGKLFITNGNATGATSLYDASQDAVVGSRLFRATSAGTNGFLIRSGLKYGRVMLITSGSAPTSLYDPHTGLVERGPDFSGPLGDGALNIPVTSGTNTGMQYILQGGGTSTVHKYNPATNTFALAAGAGADYSGTIAAKNTGSRHFLIASGPKIDNYLILSGGGTTTADLFDPATNTFSAFGGGVAGCASGVNAGSWVFRLGTNAGANNGKYIIICGGSFTTSVLDPAGPSFAAGASIGGVTSPATGAHGFYIPAGIHAGKFLFFPANNTTTTRMYDPAGNSWGPFPATLCAAAGAGAFSVPISQGLHAGKILIALGGGSTNTCYFDPSANTFTAGPASGTHVGYGIGANSVAFNLGYGIYPSAYVVVYGATSTVFGHWFAY